MASKETEGFEVGAEKISSALVSKIWKLLLSLREKIVACYPLMSIAIRISQLENETEVKGSVSFYLSTCFKSNHLFNWTMVYPSSHCLIVLCNAQWKVTRRISKSDRACVFTNMTMLAL